MNVERMDTKVLDPQMSHSHRNAPPETTLISVVIPVYHNARSLSDLLSRLRAVADKHAHWQWEWIFVDDASRDDSAAVLAELQQHEPRMTVVRMVRNVGSNMAVLAGLGVAPGVAVGVISADLQDPPELLPTMFARWQQGAPLVLATRTARHDPWWVSSGAQVFYHLLRLIALPKMPRAGFDFCVLDRSAVDELLRRHQPIYLAGEIVALGMPLETIHYTRQARLSQYGRSMWTFTKRARLAWQAMANYSRRTPGEWLCCGLLTIAVGVLWLILNSAKLGVLSGLSVLILFSLGTLCLGFARAVRALQRAEHPRAGSFIASVARTTSNRETRAA